MSDRLPQNTRTSSAAARNRGLILAVVRPFLPRAGLVLEIASGTGEHAVYFAAALPSLDWQPTDPDMEARASISAWAADAALPNLRPPLQLDAADPANWPVRQTDAIININMIHIAPWAATEGLMQGASRVLPAGGRLALYGPFLERDVRTAPSNLEFDDSLKRRNPAWGIRHLDNVAALAGAHGLTLAGRITMPANNLVVVFTML